MTNSANHKQSLPKHIAIIMDGNGRWAQQRYLPRTLGHKAGVKAVREIVQVAISKRIEVLSLFAFSSENWRRPAQEVDFLMSLFCQVMETEMHKLHSENVQIRIIGDHTNLHAKLLTSMHTAQELTKSNTGLKLIVALNYGGRWDILQAVKQMALKVKEGRLEPENITFDNFNLALSCADVPEPDLLIRTSGEQRLSNFMIWQLAYTEFYFTQQLWPDFNAASFEEALKYYAERQRRFGYTAEQLEEFSNHA